MFAWYAENSILIWDLEPFRQARPVRDPIAG